MTQLVLNGIPLPELEDGKYRCFLETKGVTLRMANGALTTQNGYTYTVIEAGPYEAMDNAYKNAVLAVLRSKNIITVAYLPDDGEETQAGMFRRMSLTPPIYAYSFGSKSYWHGLAFRLEGVEAVD